MNTVAVTAAGNIRKNLGEGSIVEITEFRDEVTFVIRKDSLLDAAKLLKEDPELAFDFLSDLCGVDWPGRTERFEVVYNLYSIKHGARLRLKVSVPENDPSIPSVSAIWPTANWHEREAYDMYGIEFTGHPNLRRILNPTDFDGFPFRKDFPIR